MTSTKYTDEELNYFRVCKVTTHIMTDGLRTVFKQEWNNRYKATHGQWQDTAKNGIDFEGMESLRSKKRNARLLALMKNGNTKEWDCTCLFHAILYSASIGPTLNPRVKKSVDELREFRNDVFAHTADGKLTVAEFEAAINKAITAFTDLKLDTTDIEEIKNQTSFPTDELEDIKKQLEKEKKRNEESRPFCLLPAKPSHETVYRPNEVEEINKEMERLKNTKKNETTVLYLSGNPGCGKSEVARQVGERFFDKSTEMSFVMTLNASTIDTLLQSYVEFAGRLRCDEEMVVKISTSASLSKERKMNDVRSLIASRVEVYSSWLMILDNVSDLKSVSKYWPQAGERTRGTGQILVTTQDSSSIPTDSYTYHLSLKKGMNFDDAISTLSRVSGSSAEESILHEVVKALDFQPLALACAAVNMQSIQSTDWRSKCLEKLKEGKREATETAYKKTSSTYPATMTETVRMAVEKEANKDEVMRCAFQFLSVIAAEPISLNYVVQYVLSCLPNKDKEVVKSIVCSSSLVLSSDKEESKDIHVHQVVHSCLQLVILNEERSYVYVIPNAILAFYEIIFSDAFKITVNMKINVVATRPLLGHFTTLALKLQHKGKEFLRLLRDSEYKKKVMMCLNKMQYICNVHARYEAADILFQKSNMIIERLLNGKDPGFATTLNDRGNNLFYCGRYTEAMKCLEKALAIEENSGGDYHLCIIATLGNLGKTLLELGRCDEAMQYIERSLSIQERVYGREHYLWSTTLSIQGCIFQRMGQLKQAKTLHEKALEIQEAIHVKNMSSELPLTLNNMGCLLRELGQLEESKGYLERAIEITESLYDEKHPALENSLRHLGETFSDLGQFDDALRNFQRALDIGRRKYGEDKHPSQARTLGGIGACLLSRGKYEESKSYLKRALDIMEKVYHDDERHPSLLETMNSLACALVGLKQFKEANILLKKVLERQEHLFEEKNPDFAVKLYNNLAATLEQMHQDQESKVYLDKALAVQESKYGGDLPPETLALIFHSLGEHKRTFGRYIEAEEYHRKAIDIKEKICPSHPDLALMLEMMGETLSSSGKYDEARVYLERALKIQESVYDKSHPELATTAHQLGITFLELKRYKEAKTHLEKALTIERNVHGERSALKADIQDLLSIAIREEQKQEKKQKRERRRQQKQERQDKHKQKYGNKRKS